MDNPPRLTAATARLLGNALRSGDADVQQLAAGLVLRFFRVSPDSTQAPPGSAQIAVMAKRVAAGYSPFHPLDMHLDGLPEDAGLVGRFRRQPALPRVLGVVKMQGTAEG